MSILNFLDLLCDNTDLHFNAFDVSGLEIGPDLSGFSDEALSKIDE